MKGISPTEKYQNSGIADQRRDVVAFDLRGAGVSQRLGWEGCCVLALESSAPADHIDALLKVDTTKALLGYVSGGATASTGMENTDSPKAWELDYDTLNGICWDHFTTLGIDPNQFTTASNVRDALFLVQELGYNTLNLYGVSYGTRLARCPLCTYELAQIYMKTNSS